MFINFFPYALLFLGILLFSSSIYFLRNYIECLRFKDKEPKITSELAIFILLILGFSVFSFGCYIV